MYVDTGNIAIVEMRSTTKTKGRLQLSKLVATLKTAALKTMLRIEGRLCNDFVSLQAGQAE